MGPEPSTGGPWASSVHGKALYGGAFCVRWLFSRRFETARRRAVTALTPGLFLPLRVTAFENSAQVSILPFKGPPQPTCKARTNCANFRVLQVFEGWAGACQRLTESQKLGLWWALGRRVVRSGLGSRRGEFLWVWLAETGGRASARSAHGARPAGARASGDARNGFRFSPPG